MHGHRVARAKLNLALHVAGQRADGYHELHSLVAFATFGDHVSVAPAERDALTVKGPFASSVPPLADNTLGSALQMARGWGLAPSPIHITLTKNLPVASGIGGGSADAAALIDLLATDVDLSTEQLRDCLALGADIPMCLHGQSAVIGGIGEVVQAVALPAAHCVLVNPGRAVSTPAVFKALKEKQNPPLPSFPSEPMSLAALIDWLDRTRNDLMAPAQSLEPSIAAVLGALTDAPFARMSGSGATCFALYPDERSASAKADALRAAHSDWWIVSGSLGGA